MEELIAQDPQGPQPINRGLATILGNAKQLMEKVESGNYETGNVNGNLLVQNTVDANQLPADATVRTNPNQMNANNGSMMNLQNSKMPDIIKKAMVETPIPQIMMNHTFNLEDVSELVEKPIPAPQAPQRQQPVQETVQPMGGYSMNMTESQLRSVIRDEMLSFFSDEFTKKIKENTIKATINTLIKEGKIKMTAKKRK